MRLALVALLFLTSPAFAQTKLVLPVEGEWLALAPVPATTNVSRGLDLVPLDPYGRPSAVCLGEPVLSPADGVVVEAYDAYPDAPQADQHRFGNRVVIEVAGRGYMVLGSLGRGSLTVGEGDRVVAGQRIATCGFAGASRRSALHVHLQATRDILAPDSAGLPMPFANLSVRTPGGCLATSLLYPGQATC